MVVTSKIIVDPQPYVRFSRSVLIITCNGQTKSIACDACIAFKPKDAPNIKIYALSVV